MSKVQLPQSVALRFGIEVFEIQRQINFLKSKSTVHVDEIDSHNVVLEKNGIAVLPTREWLGLPPHHLTREEIEELVPSIERATAAIDRVSGELNRRIDDIPLHQEMGASADRPDLLAEWTEYLRAQLSDATIEEVGKLRRSLEISGALEARSDEEISQEVKIEIVEAAIARALFSALVERVYELHDVRERFDEIKVIAETGKPGASMGTYRQGFIAMMAAFDAAIFDLVAMAARRRFHELAAGLGKLEATKKELAESGDTNEVREGIIEERLKHARVSELLCRLHRQWSVKCVGSGSDGEFAQLNEIVERRNLQLHKRGVVDARYLKIDPKTNKPKVNVYGLKLGDVASVDEQYWSLAKELCSDCVREVTIWANKEST
jgi:hypothetical protein